MMRTSTRTALCCKIYIDQQGGALLSSLREGIHL